MLHLELIAFPSRPDSMSRTASEASQDFPLLSNAKIMAMHKDKESKTDAATGSENGAVKLCSETDSGVLDFAKKSVRWCSNADKHIGEM